MLLNEPGSFTNEPHVTSDYNRPPGKSAAEGIDFTESRFQDSSGRHVAPIHLPPPSSFARHTRTNLPCSHASDPVSQLSPLASRPVSTAPTLHSTIHGGFHPRTGKPAFALEALLFLHSHTDRGGTKASGSSPAFYASSEGALFPDSMAKGVAAVLREGFFDPLHCRRTQGFGLILSFPPQSSLLCFFCSLISVLFFVHPFQIKSVPTKPVEGQKTGTSGLRKKVFI